MPQLAKLLLKTRYQKWQEWQSLQHEFIKQRFRTDLFQSILIPRAGNLTQSLPGDESKVMQN